MASWADQISKKALFSKNFFSTSTHIWKKVNAWLGCPLSPLPKFWSSWPQGMGFRPYGGANMIRCPYSENVLNLRKSFSTSIFILDNTKCLATMSINSCTEIVKFMVPWSEVQALDQGYGHMVKNVLYIKEIFSTFTAGEDKLNAWL